MTGEELVTEVAFELDQTFGDCIHPDGEDLDWSKVATAALTAAHRIMEVPS